MWLRKNIIYIVLIAVAIILPLVMTDSYLRHLLVMVCIYGVIALGMNMCVGYMREISLGHPLFLGIGAYVSAILSKSVGLPVWTSALAGIIAAAIVGLIVGYIAISRIRGIGFAIVTFGFGLIGLLICSNWYDMTGSISGIGKIPWPTIAIPGLPTIEFNNPFQYYYLALAILILVMYLSNRVLKSRIGRSVIALRENPDLASSVGVNATKSFVFIFVLSAAVMGLAGAMYTHFIRFINTTLMGMDIILVMLIMVIVGGRGTIAGPLLGAAIYIAVPEFLRMADRMRPIIFGIIFLVCIIFMPQGIYPALASLWKRYIPKIKFRFKSNNSA